jgi:hypothetical protein
MLVRFDIRKHVYQIVEWIGEQESGEEASELVYVLLRHKHSLLWSIRAHIHIDYLNFVGAENKLFLERANIPTATSDKFPFSLCAVDSHAHAISSYPRRFIPGLGARTLLCM